MNFISQLHNWKRADIEETKVLAALKYLSKSRKLNTFTTL